jgi:predicted acetyltransferase
MVRENWDMESIKRIDHIYTQFARTYNGTLNRDETWWEQRVKKRKQGQMYVYYNDFDVAEGYIIYHVMNKWMSVHELVWINEDARKALLRFIANHDSMIEKVTIEAPATDQLAFLLDNPRIQQEIYAYFMARIVDFKVFLEQYPFNSGLPEMSFIIDLEDQHAQWNEGTHEVSINTSGKACVVKLASSRKGEGISCNIQTATAMLMGYQRPLFLHQIQRIKGSIQQVQQLETVIPRSSTYLMDFF